MTLTISQLDILIQLLEDRFATYGHEVPMIYHRLHKKLCDERKEREDLIK